MSTLLGKLKPHLPSIGAMLATGAERLSYVLPGAGPLRDPKVRDVLKKEIKGISNIAESARQSHVSVLKEVIDPSGLSLKDAYAKGATLSKTTAPSDLTASIPTEAAIQMYNTSPLNMFVPGSNLFPDEMKAFIVKEGYGHLMAMGADPVNWALIGIPMLSKALKGIRGAKIAEQVSQLLPQAQKELGLGEVQMRQLREVTKKVTINLAQRSGWPRIIKTEKQAQKVLQRLASYMQRHGKVPPGVEASFKASRTASQGGFARVPGEIKIGNTKVPNQILENAKLMLKGGTDPTTIIDTVLKGTKIGLDAFSQAYKQYAKQGFPTEKVGKIKLTEREQAAKELKEILDPDAEKQSLLKDLERKGLSGEYFDNLPLKELRGEAEAYGATSLGKIEVEPPPEPVGERFLYNAGRYTTAIKKARDNKPALNELKKELLWHQENMPEAGKRTETYARSIEKQIDKIDDILLGAKDKTFKTLRGWVAEQGGLSQKIMAKDYNLQDLKEEGFRRIIKREGWDPSELAVIAKQELPDIFRPPEGVNEGDYFIELLKENPKILTPDALAKKGIKEERAAIKAQKEADKLEATQYAEALEQELGQYNEKALMNTLPGIINEVAEMSPEAQQIVNRVIRPYMKELKEQMIFDEYKNRITKRIDAMKEEGEMTDRVVSQAVKSLGVDINKLTENDFRALTVRLNSATPLVKDQEALKQGLSDSPEAKAVDDNMNNIIKDIGKKEKGKVAPNPFVDARYYFQDIDRKGSLIDIPFTKAYDLILNRKQVVGRYRKQLLDNLMDSTPEYPQIAIDRPRQDRIEKFIRSGYTRPTGLNNEDIKFAVEYKKTMQIFEPMVRYLRFMDWYLLNKSIPNASEDSLKHAARIYEEEGNSALIEFLKDETWGVRGGYYDPQRIVDPQIGERSEDVVFGKSHLKERKGVAIEQERDLLHRTYSYINQMLNLYHLYPASQNIVGTYDQYKDILENPQRVADEVTNWLKEVKGQTGSMGVPERILRRIAGTVYPAVFTDPTKWLRNKFQNTAFYPEPLNLLRQEPMTEQDLEYFYAFVDQTLPLQEHYMFTEEAPILGLTWITNFAKKYNAYAWTDKTNRMKAFATKLTDVRRALRESDSLEEILRKAGAHSLEPIQIKRAVEVFITQGADPFARYVAKEVTNNVHFLYERSQRAIIEHGELSRVVTNLFVFPRSYTQSLIKDAAKIGYDNPDFQKKGLKNIINKIVVGMMMGAVYQTVTGKRKNPYSPLTILTWQPGGLTLGAAQDLSDLVLYTMKLLEGDDTYIDKAIISITKRIPSLFLPLYDRLINVVEAAAGQQNLPTKAFRMLRAAMDKRYRVDGGRYKVERSTIGFFQKAIFGSKFNPRTERKVVTPFGIKTIKRNAPLRAYERILRDMFKDERENSRKAGTLPEMNF